MYQRVSEGIGVIGGYRSDRRVSEWIGADQSGSEWIGADRSDRRVSEWIGAIGGYRRGSERIGADRRDVTLLHVGGIVCAE